MSSSIVDVPVFVVLVLGDIIGGFWGEGEIGDWEIRDWEIGRWRAISGGVWRFGVGGISFCVKGHDDEGKSTGGLAKAFAFSVALPACRPKWLSVDNRPQ